MILVYIINHKKVYRLMDVALLLKERHQKSARKYVKYRKVMPTKPLEHFQMDIKFVWVEEYKRHAFILSVIDVFTNVIVGRKTAYNIRQNLVKQLWEEIIENYLQPYDCLKQKIQQVFTHPYTPQENGHIESFHAILSSTLSRYRFWSLEDLEQCLVLFYEKYNNHRYNNRHRLFLAVANLKQKMYVCLTIYKK